MTISSKGHATNWEGDEQRGERMNKAEKRIVKLEVKNREDV